MILINGIAEVGFPPTFFSRKRGTPFKIFLPIMFYVFFDKKYSLRLISTGFRKIFPGEGNFFFSHNLHRLWVKKILKGFPPFSAKEGWGEITSALITSEAFPKFAWFRCGYPCL